MGKALRRLILALALAGMLSQTACNRYAWQLAADVLTVAAVATILVAHDTHYHHARCGHHYRYVEGRRVYHYEDRWEYYDEYSGQWYVYDNM